MTSSSQPQRHLLIEILQTIFRVESIEQMNSDARENIPDEDDVAEDERTLWLLRFMLLRE